MQFATKKSIMWEAKPYQGSVLYHVVTKSTKPRITYLSENTVVCILQVTLYPQLGIGRGASSLLLTGQEGSISPSLFLQISCLVCTGHFQGRKKVWRSTRLLNTYRRLWTKARGYGGKCVFVTSESFFYFIFQNVIQAGSIILDHSNKDHWDQIQRTEGGTAHLLKHYEEYATNMARNMKKTYMKPFVIVTKNISEYCPGITNQSVKQSN